MTKTDAIAAVYDAAKRIREGSLTRAAGIEELHEQFGMNRNSAKDSFVNISHMLKGEPYKRTMNALETATFLDMIRRDYGTEALRKAVKSVEMHIRYYEALPRGNKLLNIWEIVHKYRDGRGSESEGVPNSETGYVSPSTFLLEWNPKIYTWDNIQKELEVAEQRGEDAIPWDVGGNKSAGIGDRVFLMRVQNNPGIVGRGSVTAAPEEGPHWNAARAAKGETYTYVKVSFDQLFEYPKVSWAELKSPPFGEYNWTPRHSGRPIPELIARDLHALWSDATGQSTLPEDEASIKQEHKDETTKRALINARRGQGMYRRQVLRLWGNACSVTGSVTQTAIRASHIKPWRESTDDERLDPHNGLPLIASLDALFDAGLISFTSSGALIISSALKGAERRIFGLDEKSLVKTPSKNTAEYLRDHRRRHGFND